jgi:hypothetical protein
MTLSRLQTAAGMAAGLITASAFYLGATNLFASARQWQCSRVGPASTYQDIGCPNQDRQAAQHG